MRTSVWPDLIDDLPDLGFETPVQHPVCLVLWRFILQTSRISISLPGMAITISAPKKYKLNVMTQLNIHKNNVVK